MSFCTANVSGEGSLQLLPALTKRSMSPALTYGPSTLTVYVPISIFSWFSMSPERTTVSSFRFSSIGSFVYSSPFFTQNWIGTATPLDTASVAT